jgi:hypothetical protein
MPAIAPSRTSAAPAAPSYPASHFGLPEPLALGWALKPVASADAGVERLPDGRTKFWIRHDVIRGVTPRMLVWWFSHLEGDVAIGGRTYNRYRVWHPNDHVHVSYARRLPSGAVGPGARIRIKEYLGRDPRHLVSIESEILRLDEGGFTHRPAILALRDRVRLDGFARMEYTFAPAPNGTRYENCLILGRAAWWSPPVARLFIPAGHGECWIRHNIEEVGQFERFLPALYYQETGRRT